MIWNTFPAIFVFGLTVLPLNITFWPIWLETSWITNVWNLFFFVFLFVESQLGLYYFVALILTVSEAMDERDIYIINNPDYTEEQFSEHIGGLLTAKALDYFNIRHLPEVDHIVY